MKWPNVNGVDTTNGVFCLVKPKIKEMCSKREVQYVKLPIHLQNCSHVWCCYCHACTDHSKHHTCRRERNDCHCEVSLLTSPWYDLGTWTIFLIQHIDIFHLPIINLLHVPLEQYTDSSSLRSYDQSYILYCFSRKVFYSCKPCNSHSRWK